MITEFAFLGELNKGASKGYSSDAIEKNIFDSTKNNSV